MKKKESIFELIKSLTKSEKRYFKLASSRHTIGDENNYIVLFDFIVKQDSYDENLIFDHFKGASFLNKFAITKKRLYDHILDSLNLFHSGSSVDAQLYKMLHSADILYNKSLYNQCKDILRSAEKIAEKNNRFNLLLEISKKQKRLIENKGYSEISQNDLTHIFDKDKHIHNQSFTYTKLWNSKSQLFQLLAQKGVSRSAEDMRHFQAIIDDLNTIHQEHFYFDTHYLFHHIYSAYYFAINDFENCLHHLIININYFEKEHQHIINQPNNYFSILTNAIFVSEKLGNYKQANQLLEKLKRLPTVINMDNNEDLQIKLFSSINSLEISTLTLRGEFKKAEKLITSIDKGLLFYDEKISTPRRAFLEFKIAVVYLSLNKYTESLQWINKILNNNQLDQKEDIVTFTQLLDLLVHFEINNTQLLPYALKRTQRFLRSRNRLFSFEKVFLQFISKLNKSTDLIEKESIWEDLYNELATIQDDAFDSVALEYFDFKTWAESKFKRKPFAELVKMKTEKLNSL